MLAAMNMHRTFIAGLLLIGTSAFAQDTALLRCADIASRDARLDCFDALAAKARAAKAAGATPLVQAENFGRDSLPPPKAPAAAPPPQAVQAPPAAIQAVVDSVKSQIDGIVEGWGPGTVFTLANGQRWQVADGSRADLYLKSPKVTVKRAVLGGYLIELEGTNKTARVKRFE